MDRKKIVEEWINDTAEKSKEIQQTEDFKTLERIGEHLVQYKAPQYQIESELARFHANRSKGKGVIRKMGIIQWTFRIAASLFLLAAVYFGYNKITDDFMEADTSILSTNEFKTFYLPDSSKVILSRNSEISFNNEKWEKNRELKLNGEAFFSVKKGSTFTVKTNSGYVEVLGTQFDVFDRKEGFLVNCYEGVVGVALAENYIELQKGNGVSLYDKNEIANINFAESSPSWIDNRRTYRSTPLKAVFQEIERTFNVKIKTNSIDTDQLFSGQIPTTKLNEALRIVTTSIQTKFEIEGEHVSILPL